LAIYSIRHQVFVSSTFTDLKDERAEVIQAIWELDCIPTGMEAFVASNESQWQVIKKVIDECDYYVLIIGGRYGTVTDEGISYTEKEYRYAKSIGIPVLAFVHANVEEIPSGKTEKDDAQRTNLERFRSDVLREHPVRTWSSAAELGGLVSRSLVREIKVTPRPGWIRNDGTSPISLLEKISNLSDENKNLSERIAELETFSPDANLMQGSDLLELSGTRRILSKSDYSSKDEEWRADTSWDEVFADLGPALINEASEHELKGILARFCSLMPVPRGYEIGSSFGIYPEKWNEILIQFRALNYIETGVKKRGVNDHNRYWKITPTGDRHLLGLLAKKRQAV